MALSLFLYISAKLLVFCLIAMKRTLIFRCFCFLGKIFCNTASFVLSSRSLFFIMVLMKSVKYIIIVATLAFSFFSCGNANSNAGVSENAEAPSVVALTLYKGITSGDVKGVTENIYFVDSLDFNVFRDYFMMAVASDDYKERTKGFTPNYKVTSEKIDGDKAFVVLEGRGPLGNMLKIDVKLLLVDGRWKVDGNHGVFHYDPIEKD